LRGKAHSEHPRDLTVGSSQGNADEFAVFAAVLAGHPHLKVVSAALLRHVHHNQEFPPIPKQL